jgi:hypothetical protein
LRVTAPSYKTWHIPLSQETITLREAVGTLSALGAKQEDVPLMVQLVENPRFDLPGFDIFHGAVDLKTHDRIHILLGRGLLPMDEAFVIGFTMGSTNRVTTLEENLYAFFSKHLYPKIFRFRDDDVRVFRDAVKLGYISDCAPLNTVDYEARLDQPLAEIRATIGLEIPLLRAYYEIERRRYPDSKASARLLL